MSKKEQVLKKLRESIHSYAMKKGVSLEMMAEQIAELLEPEEPSNVISLNGIISDHGLEWMNPASRRQVRSALIDMAQKVLERAADSAKTAGALVDDGFMGSTSVSVVDKQSILDVIKLIV